MQLSLGTQMLRAALARAGGPLAEFDAANGIVEGNRCKGKGKGKDRSHPYKSAADPEVNNDEGNKGNNEEGYSKMMEKFRDARAQRWDAYERQSGEPEGNNDEGNNNDEPKGSNDEDAME